MRFKYEHEFDIDAPGFWKMFFEPEFMAGMFKAVGIQSHRIIEATDDGKTLRRSLHLVPVLDIPAIFKSVISDTAYTEKDLLDRARSSMTVEIIPDKMANRFKSTGTFRVEALGEKRCKRVYEGEIAVSIPLLGGKIEKYMVEQMGKSYDDAAKFTREFLAKRAG